MQVNATTASTDWNSVLDAPGLDETRFVNDDKLFVQFYRKPMMHLGDSKAAGRPIYREVDCIRIMVPGDKLSVIDRPVDSIDARRFAARYEKWKTGQGNSVEGTPLTALPRMTSGKIEEYKYFNVQTVEQLAAAPDSLGQKFMGFNEDKRSAAAFLELAKGNAPLEKMNEELKSRDAKIEELQVSLEALTKMVNDAKGKKN
jgi:hypothetical protein